MIEDNRTQQVKDYIDDHRKAGHSDFVILGELENAGWSKPFIMRHLGLSEGYSEKVLEHEKKRNPYTNIRGKYKPPIAVQIIVGLELIFAVALLVWVFLPTGLLFTLTIIELISGKFGVALFLIFTFGSLALRWFLLWGMRARVKMGLIGYSIIIGLSTAYYGYKYITAPQFALIERSKSDFLLEFIVYGLIAMLLGFVWFKNRKEYI